MIKDDGDMESESDRSDCEGMPPLEDSDEDDLALPVAESLVIRRTLQVQIKEDESNQQRENIFHTCCYMQSKVCGLIIDSGSCVNVCSTTLVSKLNLSIVKHAKPYRLQWLNDSGEVKVTKQVVVNRIGMNYLFSCSIALIYNINTCKLQPVKLYLKMLIIVSKSSSL